MSHEAGSSINFHALLLALDQRAFEQVRAARCRRCEGPLFAAHYRRKPRGLSEDAAEAGQYGKRLSLCCGREGCRARATPPSVRFLGRRVYAAIAMLLLSLRRVDITASEDGSDLIDPVPGPSWPTRSRWRSWWCMEFVLTPWFAVLRGQLRTPLDAARLPGSLLGMFAGAIRDQCTSMLIALCPLTTASLLPEHSRIAMAN